MVKLGYDTPGSGPIIASATPILEALVKEQPLDVDVPLPQGQDPIVYGTLLVLVIVDPFLLVVLTCHSCRDSERRTYSILHHHGRAPRDDDAGGVHDLL